MKYKLTTKNASGKWWTYGNMKESDRGGFNLGIRITPEFLSLVEAAKEKGWLNLSAFEEDGVVRNKAPQGYEESKQAPISDEIPF